MPDPIHVVDSTLTILLFNQAFRRWNDELGLPLSVVGKSLQEMFPFLPKNVIEEYSRVFHTGQVLVTEEKVRVGEREIVTETRKIPICQGSRVIQIITVVRDISARKRVDAEREQLLTAERQLRLEAETLRGMAAAVNSSLDPQQVLPLILEQLARVVPYDSASIILQAGDSMKLVAYRNSDQGQPFSLTPLPVEATPHLQEVLRQKKPLLISDLAEGPTLRNKSTGDATRSWMGVPLIVQEQVIGLLNVNSERPNAYSERDAALAADFATQSATAIRNARLFDDLQRSHAALAMERALLAQRVSERTTDLSAANAELARAARLKDEFLANMSHELRTPLNAILGFAEVLLEQVHGPLNERQARSVASIERSGRHLLSLINDILDISKIEAGKVQLDIEAVGVSAICQASLQMVTQDAEKKRLRVQLDVTVDEMDVPLQADERRLKQILVNMLSNAIKFTPDGGTIGLDVDSDAEHEALRFAVWDTGIGMSSDDIRRLFQPFVQLDSSLARRYMGTGLGLSLVHRLTKLHGGSISVESTPGKGSRFSLLVPLNQPGQGSGVDSTGPSSSASHADREAQPVSTVLIVTDQASSLGLRTGLLTSLGHRVLGARTLAEAFEQIGEGRPDVVLLDLQLPGSDPLQAVRRLRSGDAHEHAPALIGLSTLAFPGDRERSQAVGLSLYLLEPVTSDGLVKAIEANRTRVTG